MYNSLVREFYFDEPLVDTVVLHELDNFVTDFGIFDSLSRRFVGQFAQFWERWDDGGDDVLLG